jgi:hypothetical protein
LTKNNDHLEFPFQCDLPFIEDLYWSEKENIDIDVLFNNYIIDRKNGIALLNILAWNLIITTFTTNWESTCKYRQKYNKLNVIANALLLIDFFNSLASENVLLLSFDYAKVESGFVF